MTRLAWFRLGRAGHLCAVSWTSSWIGPPSRGRGRKTPIHMSMIPDKGTLSGVIWCGAGRRSAPHIWIILRINGGERRRRLEIFKRSARARIGPCRTGQVPEQGRGASEGACQPASGAVGRAVGALRRLMRHPRPLRPDMNRTVLSCPRPCRMEELRGDIPSRQHRREEPCF